MYYDRVTAAGGPTMVKQEGSNVISMLRFLIYYALGRTGELNKTDEDPMTVEGTPEELNQQLLRESKMIDALFLMLSAPTVAHLDLFKLKKVDPQLEIIHNLVLKAIKFTFFGNSRNELYLADHCLKQWNHGTTDCSTMVYMKMLIESLQSHEEAAVVYQTLVSNNKELLETKIDENDVDIFLKLIQKRGPVAEFLQFLTAICACQGEPLVRNQELMLKVLYSASLRESKEEQNRYKLCIETIVDPRGISDSHNRMFTENIMGAGKIDVQGVMGGKILTEGFQHLLVGWYGSDDWQEDPDETAFYHCPDQIGITPIDVEKNLLPADLQNYHQKANLSETGKRFQWVRLRDVVWTLQPDVMKRKAEVGGGNGAATGGGWTDYQEQMEKNPKMRVHFLRTRDMAEYYVAQIELYATMCFDRSYNCMGHLQKQFSYEVLVTAVADTALPDQLRSVFAELLYVLYVDKFPQETLRVPNLVRPESSVKAMSLKDKEALPRFQYVQANRAVSEGSSDIVNLDGAADADREESSPTKFYILQEVIAEHMQNKLKGLNVLSLKELNKLTLRMLECLEKLFFSGFYSTYGQVKTFVISAIKLLDGRSDVDDLNKLLEQGIHFMDRRATRDVQDFGRGTVAPTKTVLVEKQSNGAKGILSKFAGGGQAGQSGDDLAMSPASAMKRKSGKSVKMKRDSAFDLEVSSDFAESQLPDRYTPTAESMVVVEMKRKILTTVSLITDVTLDFRVTNILNAIKSTEFAQLFSTMSDRKDFSGQLNLGKLSFMKKEEEKARCLSQDSIDSFLAVFSGREDADLPHYYTDEDILSKVASAVGGFVNGATGGLATAGGLATGGLATGLRLPFADDSLAEVKEDAEALRMNKLCHPQPFVSICLDLMMYQDEKLFDSALDAYVNFFMEIDTVVNSLDNVQVLESARASAEAEGPQEDTVTATEATSAKNDLALLQFHVDTFEVWGEDTEFATFDQAIYDDVVRYIRSVTNFLLAKEEGVFVEPDDIGTCTPVEARQDIMFNYKAYETMQEILEIDSEQEDDDGLPLPDSTTHRLKDFAIAFLILFCSQNPVNQVLVHDSMIDLLLENIKTLEDAPELLAAVFKDNGRLCANVPRDLLEKLMESNYTRWLAGLPPKADYLELFDSIVSSDGAPNPENQKVVLEVLTQEQFEPLMFLKYWKTEGEDQMSTLYNFTESIATVRASAGYKEFQTYMCERDPSFERQSGLTLAAVEEGQSKPADWIDAYMAYLTGLLSLLANVAAGKNTHGELKCQSQVPLVFVMALVGDPLIYNVPGFHVSTLTFLTEVFYDTDLAEFSTNLAGQLEFWELMESQCADIEKFNETVVPGMDGQRNETTPEDDDEYTDTMEHYIFNGVLPSIEGFFVNCLADTGTDPDAQYSEKELLKRQSLNQKVQRSLSKLHNNSNKFTVNENAILKRVKRVVASSVAGEEFVMVRTKSRKPGERRESKKASLQGVKLETLSNKLKDFVEELKKDEKVKDEMNKEKTRLVKNLLNIKTLTDKKEEHYKKCCELTDRAKNDRNEKTTLGKLVEEADPRDFTITFSRLITRMVQHVRDGCDETENAEVQRKTIWVLSKVLEHHLPPDQIRNETYEIEDKPSDEDGNAWKWKLLWWISGGIFGGSHLSADQDLEDARKLHRAKQHEMDDYNVSKLVIDVIGESKDERVVLEAVKLGIEMLEFGNHKVQETMFEYFDELASGSDKFFSRISQNIEVGSRIVRDRRQRQQYLDKSGGGTLPPADSEEDYIRLDLVFRLLQLFTEGHNNNMQNLIRDQSSIGCRNSHNLLQQSVEYLTAVAQNRQQLKVMAAGDAEDAVRVLDFLIESIQGPCAANQELLANSVMVDICSTIISFPISTKVPVVDRKNLKALAAKALLSLLEGREDMLVVSQLAQKLEPKSIRRRIVKIHKEYLNLQSISNGSVSSSISLPEKFLFGGSNKGVSFAGEGGQADKPDKGFGADLEDLDPEVQEMLQDSNWDEEFLEEGFELLMLANRLTTEEAVMEVTACEEFLAPLSIGDLGKKPDLADFKKPREFERSLADYNAKLDFAKARTFFQKRLRVVEIVWQKPGASEMTVEPMLFPAPSECVYMPLESRERVRNLLEYSSEDRMSQFLDESKALIAEMQHLENLGKYQIYVIVGKNLSLVKYLGFMVSILMNTLLLICLVAPHGEALANGDAFEFEPAYMGNIVFAFGLVQLVLGAIILGFILASRAPLVYKEQERKRTNLELSIGSDLFALADETTKFIKNLFNAFRSTLVSMVMVTMVAILYYLRYLEDGKPFPEWYTYVLIVLTFLLGVGGLRKYLAAPTSPVTFTYVVVYDVVTHKETLFYVLYVVAAVLGLNTPWFYCYHLMYLVVASEELQNVVRAVTVPFQALSLTFVLLFILIYVFTLLYFFFQRERFWNDDLGQNECNTLGRCFIVFVRNGLLAGGGIGDYVAGELGHAPDLNSTEDLFLGTIFDLLYFIIVLVLLLNIVFGIIIGKFFCSTWDIRLHFSKCKSQSAMSHTPAHQFLARILIVFPHRRT
jgi:hypothetical protein